MRRVSGRQEGVNAAVGNWREVMLNLSCMVQGSRSRAELLLALPRFPHHPTPIPNMHKAQHYVAIFKTNTRPQYGRMESGQVVPLPLLSDDLSTESLPAPPWFTSYKKQCAKEWDT